MSNFPIDVFHIPNSVPNAPTFGVKLGIDRHEPHRVTTPFELAIAIFNSARHTLDYDFIKRNPDYRHSCRPSIQAITIGLISVSPMRRRLTCSSEVSDVRLYFSKRFGGTNINTFERTSPKRFERRINRGAN